MNNYKQRDHFICEKRKQQGGDELKEEEHWTEDGEQDRERR